MVASVFIIAINIPSAPWMLDTWPTRTSISLFSHIYKPAGGPPWITLFHQILISRAIRRIAWFYSSWIQLVVCGRRELVIGRMGMFGTCKPFSQSSTSTKKIDDVTDDENGWSVAVFIIKFDATILVQVSIEFIIKICWHSLYITISIVMVQIRNGKVMVFILKCFQT